MIKPKQIQDPKNQRWFKTARTQAQPSMKVDREKGIIHDVVLAQAGPAIGHGTFCEMPFISKIVDEGIKRPQGVKSRFSHPSMCVETLGSFSGRVYNFRLHGDQALGDLHLSQTALKSPKGDLYNYLLDMAENEPDMFGMSVVTSGNKYWQKDDNGDYVEIQYDENGYAIMDEEKEVYETFEELNTVDFVDEGALTPGGLFSVEFNRDSFAVMITDFLDNNTKIDQFLKGNPGKLIDFMNNRYGTAIALKDNKTLFQRIRDIFGENKSLKPQIIKYMSEFDINATTTDGLAITIISESADTPSVGDAVVDANTGDSLPDGDYVIADDSAALAGSTITVAGGVIADMKEKADDNPPPPPGPKGDETVDSLKAAVVALKKQKAALEAQLKKAAGGEFTPNFNPGNIPGKVKTEVLSDNQKAAREEVQKAQKKFSKPVNT